MPADTLEQLLDRAASLSGIEPGYWDIWGRHHDTSTAAKQAILEALGIAAGNAEQLEQSLAALTRREWERLAPPTVVCGQSGEQQLPLNLAVESLGERARLVIRREDGQSSECDLNLWELPQTAHIEMDGRTWVRKMATPAGPPAARLSRDFGASVAGACGHGALHRDARARLGLAASRPRRPRGRHRRQPLRRALGAQLGLRRFPRPAGGGGFRRRSARVRLRGAESRCTPSTTGGRSIPARICRTAPSTRTSCISTSRAWRISHAAGARGVLRGSPEVTAEIDALRARRSWNTNA